MIKNAFKDILLERALESSFPYVRRAQPHRLFPRKALAVIGVRRCGKSTFLRQIWEELLEKGKAKPHQLVYVNFFDERLYDLKAVDLGLLLEAVDELNPQRNSRETLYFFLDEIQTVQGWERFVDRLIRTENSQVILSGSSASLLSREISSAMRGRSLSVEMFPFSWGETIKAEGWVSGPRSAKDRARLLARCRAYLQNGGFPETRQMDPFSRRRVLQEYLDVVVLKDVIERHNPRDPAGLLYLARMLMNQIGSFYTINKLTERLHSVGHKITKAEVSQFIEWFHDSYLLFSVPLYTNAISRQWVNPRKLYCVDSGLVNHVNRGTEENLGHLLENTVFMELRRHSQRLYYFRDASQREVDFVCPHPGGSLRLIQVCSSLKKPEVRDREILALHSAMATLKQKEGWLVTLEESEELRHSRRAVHILPAWDFFSKLSDDPTFLLER